MKKLLIASSLLAVPLFVFNCTGGGRNDGNTGGGGASGEAGQSSNGKGGGGGKGGKGGSAGKGGAGGGSVGDGGMTGQGGGSGGAAGGGGAAGAGGGAGGAAGAGGAGTGGAGGVACVPTMVPLKAAGVAATSCEFKLPNVMFDPRRTPCWLGGVNVPFDGTNGWGYTMNYTAIMFYGTGLSANDGGVGDGGASDGGTGDGGVGDGGTSDGGTAAPIGWCDKVKAGTDLLLTCTLNCML